MQAGSSKSPKLASAEDRPHELASAALKLLREGMIGEGGELYRAAVRAGRAKGLPSGLHYQMLSQNAPTAAQALYHAALLEGANLCIAEHVPGARSEDIVAEYRSLFARGDMNGGMIADYLVHLSRIGADDEIAMVFSPDRKLQKIDLMSGDAPRLSAIRDAILNDRENLEWKEAWRSVRKMDRVKQLAARQEPVLQELFCDFEAEVRKYAGNIQPRHAIESWIPRTFDIQSWAVISRGEGYHVAHIHPKAWLSGVFYVAAPEPSSASGGSLCFGRPQRANPESTGWPDVTIQPEPGMLVLAPSFYTHWTIPLGAPGLRIAIAFDVCDRRESVPG